MVKRSAIWAGLLVVGLAGAGGPARAAANLVVNGDFESFTNPSSTPTSSYQVTSPNNPTGGGTLTGWTNAGYTFLFNAGTAYTTGAYSSEYSNTLCLYGPGSCGGNTANGMTAASPTGGNFIGVDGAYQSGAISQTISGLTLGQNYTLSFYWAAGQQDGYNGVTTDSWGVSFGNQTYNTQTITNPNNGFTPWMQQTFTFTATSASQTLSFLAAGAPSGTPPFALLDGISLVQTPEPATLALLAVGLVGGLLAHRWLRGAGITPA